MSHEILQRVRAHDQKLWVPGRGELTAGQTAAQKVIEEYDERLVLARHELTGDWVVFIKVARDDLYPVLGLGPEIPDAEEIKRRLWQADAQRRGNDIRAQVNAHNDRIRAENKYRADEAAGETAEHLEWGYRREGWHPSPRIFVP